MKQDILRNNIWPLSIAMLTAAGFSAVLILINQTNILPALDAEISQIVQTFRDPLLDAFAIAITLSGDTIVLVWVAAATIIALAANRMYRLAFAVLIASISTPFLVVSLKAWIARPRPTADLYPGVEAFSFPSGHTTNSAVLYGILVLLALSPVFGKRRIWLAVILGLLIFLIGLSRIYLAAHWPSDVLAGWCIAATVLTCFFLVIRRTPTSDRRKRTVLWVAFSAALFGLAYGAYNFSLALEKYSPRTAIEVTQVITPAPPLKSS